VKELELMVGRGANVNEVDLRNDDKFTPLHWAAHAGSLEVGITCLYY
jgi:ankyrin repeat protein